MKILVAAVGSHGDVLPMIGLCKALRERGQEVILYASAYFTTQAAEAGVTLRAFGASETYLALLRDPDLVHPMRGHRLIARALTTYLPELYHALEADIEPGRTVLVGTLLAFPVRLLNEQRAVPCVIVHLSPATLRSNFAPTRVTARDLSPRLPPMLRGLLWRGIDRWMLDPVYGEPLNRFRRTLGMRPVRSVLGHWMNAADLVVALFPSRFAAPQPDWPTGLRQTGFPLYDSAQPLPMEVKDFLDRGPPPVGFTAGTATAAAHDFFAAAVAACARCGRRGVLLTHIPEQVPQPLPTGIAHFSYVPFGALLPRLAAFVHHGGIGTTSQALRAGVPQLIRPMAYDQLDNARRAQNLGVAVEILPRHFDGRTAARALEELIGDQWVNERCRNWADVLANTTASETTASLIIDAFPLAQSSTSVAT